MNLTSVLFLLVAAVVTSSLATDALSSDAVSSSTLATSRSNTNQSLRRQIIHGASRRMLKKEEYPATSYENVPPAVEAREGSRVAPRGEYSYYVREGRRSEISAITDVLMDSFHPGCQPSFDSYIRRYKYNHLLMCFDAIDERDRGLFVACAVPVASSLSTSASSSFGTSSYDKGERIIGFCSVDGRAPDTSTRIDFMTPTTLAGTSPRPYLSDLGVSPSHRRWGIGEQLVTACERWTLARGYDKLYLKVEEKNAAAVSFYSSLDYEETRLPWGNENCNNFGGGRWDATLLLEKSLILRGEGGTRAKRSWIKDRFRRPKKEWLNQKISTETSAAPRM
ncbi:hypothetical protein ACHAXA_005830 [Cyclostephanos tholiformis]|uniref:N-acetyltransferase domain-containing protein n=1 Tax=Cyclostephanos tholiformis TaxID=382380 RepID=A0ABD3S019_9STRA